MPADNATPASSPNPGQPPAQPSSRPGPPPGTVVDRRIWGDRDRRALAVDGQATGLERRRGVGRRLSDFTRSAEEGELTKEQFLFLMAIEAFKKSNDKAFPTWTDVLEVVRLLGYRKTMPSELKLGNAEDWTEPANAPTKVRSKPGHPETGWTGDREAA
jgi:hypothetical protein